MTRHRILATFLQGVSVPLKKANLLAGAHIWFPLKYLLIESLQNFHHYLGDAYKVEFPTGSGEMMSLWEVADELSRRIAGETRRFGDRGPGATPRTPPIELLLPGRASPLLAPAIGP